MNVVLFIAKRYLFSKKSSNAVNIISWISVFSIAIATFALVVVLSAFNGLQTLVESMYEEFEADVRVMPATGKWINEEDVDFKIFQSIDGIEKVHKVVEELTLVRYGKQQSPCTIKGVEEGFLETSGIYGSIFDGSANLEFNHQPGALVGYGLASVLSVYVDDAMNSLKFYAPKVSGKTIINPEQAFYTKSISPSGIFAVNPDIDNKYVIVPIQFAQDLMKKKDAFSALEIKVGPGKEKQVQKDLRVLLGENYEIKTRFELNEIIYQTNQSEKVVTFFILAFILVIAAFNVISSLTMILLEKQEDIRTMRILGFGVDRIRKIFVSEGMFINLIGIGIGMISGLIISLLQIHYGLVRLEGGIVEFYPVKLVFTDFILILATALVIAYIASFFPARILIKTDYYESTSESA